MQQRFKVNYAVVCSMLVMFMLSGLVWLWLFVTPLAELLSGETLPSETSRTLGTFTILWFGLLIFLIGVVISETSACFSDEFIRKGRLRQTKFMWRDVTSVYRFGYRVIIRSTNKKMEINLVYYSDPDKIMRFIQDHTQTQG